MGATWHKLWKMPTVYDKEVKALQRVNIEAERARMQMTKEQMCAELGITNKTYLSYIRGGSIPSTVLVKLSEMTGKSTDYLLGLAES